MIILISQSKCRDINIKIFCKILNLYDPENIYKMYKIKQTQF